MSRQIVQNRQQKGRQQTVCMQTRNRQRAERSGRQRADIQSTECRQKADSKQTYTRERTGNLQGDNIWQTAHNYQETDRQQDTADTANRYTADRKIDRQHIYNQKSVDSQTDSIHLTDSRQTVEVYQRDRVRDM